VFCAFSSEAAADAVLSQVPPQWRGWKAKSLTQHPLGSIFGIDLAG
jgi:4-diphosphocytidyl-2-C-methyl-D-erythritol kinase